MQTLFSNPVMPQNLAEAIANSNGFRAATDPSFNLVPTNPFLKPESPPEASQSSTSSSSPENATNSTPTSPNSESTNRANTPHGNSSETNFVKERLVSALREIIPHRRSLNLRMLVTYTVDDATPDVIIVDETINREDPVSQPANDGASSSNAASGSVLDLSQRSNPTNVPEPNINPLPGPSTVMPLADHAASIFNTNPALLMLSSLLNNGSNSAAFSAASTAAAAALNLPSLNFPLPLNLTPQQTAGMAPTNEIPPNVNINTGEQASGVSRRSESSIDNASRSSSPLSNRGRESSPSTSLRPTPRIPTTYSRRFLHPRRFNCNQCRQNFNSLAELNRHTMDQHNSFRCTFCRARFTQRSNLQRHSLKHVGFKPFSCNICRKEYYRKDHLVRHIEVTHPHVDPRVNITTRLSSSECLDFLENMQNLRNSEGEIGENGGELSPNETVAATTTATAAAEEETQGTSFTSLPNGAEEASEPQAMQS